MTKWLSKDDNNKIYYEVQPIFRNFNDQIPIGNRLFAYNTHDQFHVFISNCNSKSIEK